MDQEEDIENESNLKTGVDEELCKQWRKRPSSLNAIEHFRTMAVQINGNRQEDLITGGTNLTGKKFDLLLAHMDSFPITTLLRLAATMTGDKFRLMIQPA